MVFPSKEFKLFSYSILFYRNIVKFNFLRRDGIRVQQTGKKSIPGDPTAVYKSMKWAPVNSDIGKHILCANAEDSNGYR